jgi:hypothetical protein
VTPADFAVAVLGEGAVDSVPKDFAVEVAPFWLVAGQRVSWRDDADRGVVESVGRTFALSAATAEPDGGEGDPRLSVGAAFALVSGRIPQAVRDSLTVLEGALARESAVFNQYFARYVTDLDRALEADLRRIRATVPPAQLPAAIAERAARYETALNTARDSVGANAEYRLARAEARERTDALAEGLSLRREGWFAEVAAAVAWAFADRSWEAGQFDRAGAWANVSYEGALPIGRASTLTPVVTVRYLSAEEVDATRVGLLDVGGRLVLAGARYALSIEGVLRTAPSEDAFDEDHRVVALAEYEVGTGLWLRGGFGRDLEGEGRSTFLARLGLSFSFSRDRYTLEE